MLGLGAESQPPFTTQPLIDAHSAAEWTRPMIADDHDSCLCAGAFDESSDACIEIGIKISGVAHHG